MKYEVRWSDPAYEDLAAIYLEVGDGRLLDEAIRRIERALRDDPLGVGRPCDADRLYRDDPLLVFYSIDPAAHLVLILSVADTR